MRIFTIWTERKILWSGEDVLVVPPWLHILVWTTTAIAGVVAWIVASTETWWYSPLITAGVIIGCFLLWGWIAILAASSGAEPTTKYEWEEPYA